MPVAAGLSAPPDQQGSAMRDPSEKPDTVPPIGRLKRRADFVRAGKGQRWHGQAMSLQANALDAASECIRSDSVRIGFTLTKKVGNSVIRNRARRRLREAVRLSEDLPVRPGHDYVIVGRLDAIHLPFAALREELHRAVRGIHATRGSGRSAKHPNKTRPQRTRLSP
jgi:ribonuclease P protein component